MPLQEENVFTSYTLTKDEYVLGATYSDLQRMHIQNQLAMYAQQKLAISAEDYYQQEVFIRNHEYHRGLVDGMRFLLELDRSLRNEAEETVADIIAKQQEDMQQQEREEGDFA